MAVGQRVSFSLVLKALINFALLMFGHETVIKSIGSFTKYRNENRNGTYQNGFNHGGWVENREW